MSYSDPDIQEAPIYPVLFQIEQDGQTVLTINSKEEFVVRCSAYVPTNLMQQIKHRSHFIYAPILANGSPVIQQIGQITPPSNPENSIIQFAVNFNLDDKVKTDQVNLQLAITAKHKGEMGIGESIRVGRFVNTYIPLGEKYE